MSQWIRHRPTQQAWVRGLKTGWVLDKAVMINKVDYRLKPATNIHSIFPYWRWLLTVKPKFCSKPEFVGKCFFTTKKASEFVGKTLILSTNAGCRRRNVLMDGGCWQNLCCLPIKISLLTVVVDNFAQNMILSTTTGCWRKTFLHDQ